MFVAVCLVLPFSLFFEVYYDLQTVATKDLVGPLRLQMKHLIPVLPLHFLKALAHLFDH